MSSVKVLLINTTMEEELLIHPLDGNMAFVTH